MRCAPRPDRTGRVCHHARARPGDRDAAYCWADDRRFQTAGMLSGPIRLPHPLTRPLTAQNAPIWTATPVIGIQCAAAQIGYTCAYPPQTNYAS
jgi:hypothetical protein